MAVSQTLMRHVTLSVVVLGAVFAVLSTAGNHWASDKTNSDYHSGLWKKCIPSGCYDLDGNGMF